MNLAAALQPWAPSVLGVVRVVSGLLFFAHGSQKLLGFPPRNPEMAPVELASLMGVAGALELVGGALLVLGLFTRPVAFVLSGEMAVAYFMMHAPQSPYPVLNAGDAAILYCFFFLYLVFEGPGPWSLDALRGRGRRPYR